jgi:hypothetical protein
MKLDSKLFDGVRIHSRREAKAEVVTPACAWEGCEKPGIYKAPKGNRSEGEYHNFCLEHVRHYNTTFNFFSGMSADDIEANVNASRLASDPLHVFARYARSQARNPQAEREIKLHELDRRALETLGIAGPPKSPEIKKAYKTLVKIHHPDANGGDKSSEERLRAIISAYTHLKTKGFV